MSYELHFTPMAQAQLGVVPHEVFGSIRAELDALAELASLSPMPTELMLPTPMGFAIGEFAVLYRVDPTSRTLTVVEVARRMWDCA